MPAGFLLVSNFLLKRTPGTYARQDVYGSPVACVGGQAIRQTQPRGLSLICALLHRAPREGTLATITAKTQLRSTSGAEQNNPKTPNPGPHPFCRNLFSTPSFPMLDIPTVEGALGRLCGGFQVYRRANGESSSWLG